MYICMYIIHICMYKTSYIQVRAYIQSLNFRGALEGPAQQTELQLCLLQKLRDRRDSHFRAAASAQGEAYTQKEAPASYSVSVPFRGFSSNHNSYNFNSCSFQDFIASLFQ